MNEEARDSKPVLDSLRVVVISGLSGAGKSTALHALEDLGYFCVDNIPTKVVPAVVSACREGAVRRIALGIDVRVRSFLDDFGVAMDALVADPLIQLSVVFLDANDSALLSRFSATRRPHPLSTVTDGSEREAVAVLDGVLCERERLSKVRVRATNIIDTTALNVHDLRHLVVELFGPGVGKTPGVRVRLLTFGFKYGSPVDADLILDVRFLRNPYFEDHLRHLTGRDSRVARYVLDEPETQNFVQLAHDLVAFCVPRYEREGKAYLTIAVGCTGGRHRSVAVGIELARKMEESLGIRVKIVHRDIERDSSFEPSSNPDIIGGGARGTGRGPG